MLLEGGGEFFHFSHDSTGSLIPEEEEEATGATEAVLSLPRVGGIAALRATLPKWGFMRSLLTTSTLSPTCSFQALFHLSNTL